MSAQTGFALGVCPRLWRCFGSALGGCIACRTCARKALSFICQEGPKRPSTGIGGLVLRMLCTAVCYCLPQRLAPPWARGPAVVVEAQFKSWCKNILRYAIESSDVHSKCALGPTPSCVGMREAIGCEVFSTHNRNSSKDTRACTRRLITCLLYTSPSPRD